MKKLLPFLLLAVALVCAAFFAPQATLTSLVVVGLSAGAVYVVANHSRALRRSSLIGAVNIAEGTHKNAKPYKADAAVATRYLLAKIGSDADHSAACGASDIPIGFMQDEAAAAEDLIAVELLGISNRTLLGVASEAITAGEAVYTAAGGKLQDLPAGAGTYYKVGHALTAAGADGDLIEIQHCAPIATVVT
jgi:hypothetical protein